MGRVRHDIRESSHLVIFERKPTNLGTEYRPKGIHGERELKLINV